jgi:hypothetical protein
MKKVVLLLVFLLQTINLFSGEHQVANVGKNPNQEIIEKIDKTIKQMEAVKEPVLKANLVSSIINFKFIKQEFEANQSKIPDQVKIAILSNLKLKGNDDLQNLSKYDFLVISDHAYQIDSLLAKPKPKNGAGIKDFATNLFKNYLKGLILEPKKYVSILQDKKFMERIKKSIDNELSYDTFENMALLFQEFFLTENYENEIKKMSASQIKSLIFPK